MERQKSTFVEEMQTSIVEEQKSDSITRDKYPRFSKIHRLGPCSEISQDAKLEWEKYVHTKKEAREWHSRWTPWFSGTVIDALLNHYEKELKSTNP